MPQPTSLGRCQGINYPGAVVLSLHPAGAFAGCFPRAQYLTTLSADKLGIASAMTDWLLRAACKIGFRVARLWWRLRRPDHDGAVVAIWLNGRILVVQQSYRSNLSWPGGGIHRKEDPRDAARRELAEELGLAVNVDDLVLARDMVVDWDYRCDRVRIFELHLQAQPTIRLDNREIVNARFVDPLALLGMDNLPPFIRDYLIELPSWRQRPPAGA
jgi:8-oxo-dGTP diphosphatase